MFLYIGQKKARTKRAHKHNHSQTVTAPPRIRSSAAIARG
jgi:hypothetical protein